MRPSSRANDQLRSIKIQRHYTKYAEGSVLIEVGETKVLCNASVIDGVPKFLKGSGNGWVTAEYAMLPRATMDRTQREVNRGSPGGRTMEIQRLIGRALRSAVDMKALGENTIALDCDVLQADGGTRTASITGAMVALVDALRYVQTKKKLKANPLKHLLAAVSVGIYDGQAVLDLDYAEDSKAETDMNVVVDEHGNYIELQGTAEGEPFSATQLSEMLSLANKGATELIMLQREALE